MSARKYKFEDIPVLLIRQMLLICSSKENAKWILISVQDVKQPNLKFKYSISMHVQVCFHFPCIFSCANTCLKTISNTQMTIYLFKISFNSLLILTSHMKHSKWVKMIRINSSFPWNLDCCICQHVLFLEYFHIISQHA